MIFHRKINKNPFIIVQSVVLFIFNSICQLIRVFQLQPVFYANGLEDLIYAPAPGAPRLRLEVYSLDRGQFSYAIRVIIEPDPI